MSAPICNETARLISRQVPLWLSAANSARPGQALIETALVMLTLALCAAGVLTIHRIVDARLQVETLARETARVMGEAASYPEALAAGAARAEGVAAGLTLAPDHLTIAPAADPAFPRGSVVVVTVSYRVDLGGLPSFGLGEPVVAATARQPVQRFGSRRGGS